MTQFFSIFCFVIAFTPAFAVFAKVVAPDALRVILFFLGSFFWLVAILISSSFALFTSTFPVLFISALIQEAARVCYFVLLHRAQRDLEKVATTRFSSLRTSLASRHLLAVVCGLGFGVTAALFLLINVLADYSGHGVVGLPATVPELGEKLPVILTTKDASFPLIYSISNAFLIINNMAWTVVLWDGCHNYANGIKTNWYLSIATPVVLHLLNNFMSTQIREHLVPVFLAQVLVMLISSFHAYIVIKKPAQLRAFGQKIGIFYGSDTHSD